MGYIVRGGSRGARRRGADWTMRLPELTAGYASADIYNADDTGFYYRAPTEQSMPMVVCGDPGKGIKISKEQVT